MVTLFFLTKVYYGDDERRVNFSLCWIYLVAVGINRLLNIIFIRTTEP